MITESILNHVIQFITLSEIELNNLPHISGEFIKELCLRASKTLQKLDLTGSSIQPEQLMEIGKNCKSLTKLVLNQTSVDDISLQSFSKCSKLVLSFFLLKEEPV